MKLLLSAAHHTQRFLPIVSFITWNPGIGCQDRAVAAKNCEDLNCDFDLKKPDTGLNQTIL